MNETENRIKEIIIEQLKQKFDEKHQKFIYYVYLYHSTLQNYFLNSLKGLSTENKSSVESKLHQALNSKKHLLKEKTKYNINEDI